MTQDQVDALRVIAQAMFTPLQEELLRDLCRHIAEAGQCTSQAQYDAYKAQTLGLAPKAVRSYVQRHLRLTDDAMEEVLRYAAENTVAFEDDGSMQNIVQGYVKVAGNEARRLVENLGGVNPAGRTVPMQQLYSETMDHAFRQSISGAKPMAQALREATNKLAAAGIRTIEDKAGRSLGIEYAARRMLLDQVGQLNEQIVQMNHDELGCTGWEISAHSACAPDHEDIQGRQYSDAEYKKLNSRLKRPIGRLHCKHSADPIFLGEQQPQYSEAELAAMKRENEDGVWYEGKHYTLYEADQYQKDIENSIRLLKRSCLIDKEQHDDEQLRKHQIALNRLNTEYARYSAATGLRTAAERVQVAGFDRKEAAALARATGLKPLGRQDGDIRVHTVTADTIHSIPAARPSGASDAQADNLRRAHQELLRALLGKEATDEAGGYFDKDYNLMGIYHGKSGNVHLPPPPPGAIGSGHTHPTGTTFSLSDISAFTFREQLRILTVTGNNGVVYLLEKASWFEVSKAYQLLQQKKEKYKQQGQEPNTPEQYLQFIEEFLNESENSGLIYRTFRTGKTL